MKPKIFFALVFSCVFSISNAQTLDLTTCNERLEDAKKSYRSGQLEEVSTKIEGCLEKRPMVFSQEKMVEGYKLLTESYLFRNDVGDGTRAYERLLTFDPLFEADSTDPNNSYDLIYLSRTYRQKPIISTYINFGVNYNYINVLQHYGTDNTALPASSYKQVAIGINGAVGLEMPVWRDFTVVLEGNFSLRPYSYFDSLLVSANRANPVQSVPSNLVYSQLRFREQQFWADIPVMVRYEHYMSKYKKIIPYAYIGGAPNFLLYASLNNIQRNTIREGDFNGQVVGGETTVQVAGIGYEKELPRADRNHMRALFNMSVLAGIGSKFRVGRHFLVVEGRYTRFFRNSINIANRYNDKELLYEFNYVDNDIRMDNFSLTMGFEFSFYKPRKKRQYNPIVIEKKFEKFLQKEKNAAKRTTDSELKRELNSFLRELERNKPSILEDVRRGRSSSKVIEEAAKEADKIKDK